jgi:uncharacterized SAM-binding protein YcdF (DUF218 family)
MLTDPTKAERIERYLDASTEVPERADLAFVFGTRYRDPAYIAADLARRDVVQYVVLTGGDNPYTGKKEADAHLEILRREGIPSGRIILENESRNTPENVLCALPKIQERISLEHIEAVVVVAKWYHSRRAMMTLKRHLIEGIRYYAVVYEPEGVRRSIWWKEESSCGRVMKEWRNIPRYLAQGDIIEIREMGNAFV